MNNIRLLSFVFALCMACGSWGQEIELVPGTTCTEGVIENGTTYTVCNSSGVELEITIEKIPTSKYATDTEYKTGALVIGRNTRVFLKIQDGYVMKEITFYSADDNYNNIFSLEDNANTNGKMSGYKTGKYARWQIEKDNKVYGGPVNRTVFETTKASSSKVNTFALSKLLVKYDSADPIIEQDKELVLNIGAAGCCTYYNTDRYFMPAGCTGYVVCKDSKYTGDDIKLEVARNYPSGTLVEENRALLIKGTPNSSHTLYTNDKTVEQWISSTLSNLLMGDDTETTHPTAEEIAAGQQGLYYQFSYDSAGENLGFYWQQEGGTSITNGANKCYLFLPGASSGSTKVRGFCLDDMQEEDETGEATMITAAPYGNSPLSSAIYNIQGQQVDATFKGIVIKDGKKYYNK